MTLKAMAGILKLKGKNTTKQDDRYVYRSLPKDLQIGRTFALCINATETTWLPPELLRMIFGMAGLIVTDEQAIAYYERKFPGKVIEWETLDYSPLGICRKAQELALKEKRRISGIEGNICRYYKYKTPPDRKAFYIYLMEMILLGLYVFFDEYNRVYEHELILTYTPLAKIREFIRSGRYITKHPDKEVITRIHDCYLFPALLSRGADEELFEYLHMILFDYKEARDALDIIIEAGRSDLIPRFYLYLATIKEHIINKRKSQIPLPRIQWLSNVEVLETLYTEYLHAFGTKNRDAFCSLIYRKFIHEYIDFRHHSSEKLETFMPTMKWLYEKGFRFESENVIGDDGGIFSFQYIPPSLSFPPTSTSVEEKTT